MKKTYYVVRGTRLSLTTGKPFGHVVYAGLKSDGTYYTNFGGYVGHAKIFRTREAAQAVIGSGDLCPGLGEGTPTGFRLRYTTVKRTVRVA